MLFVRKNLFKDFLIVCVLFIFCACGNYKTEQTDKSEVKDTLQALVVDLAINDLPDSLFILLDMLQTDSVMKHASLAYMFYNLTKDSLITSYNPYQSLVPASTLKILTSAASFDILGPATRFKTVLSYDGSIEGKTLNGNLYIVGGGDPALGSAVYNQGNFIQTFLKGVKDLNIDTIAGDIIADPRIFTMDEVPFSWPHGEINWAYATAASGLNIFDNTYYYIVKKDDKGQLDDISERIFPKIPLISFYNNFVMTADEKESLTIYNLNNKYKKLVKGGFPVKTDKVVLKGAIPDPPYTLAFMVFENLLLNDVYVTGTPKTIYEIDAANKDKESKKQIAVIYSPDVNSIVQNINMNSNNFFTEVLLKHIGLKKTGVGDTESGCMAVVNYWKQQGIDTGGLFMFDGSGLSRFNACTAEQLAAILIHMKKSKHFALFYNSLPVSGVSGTMKRLCVGSNAEEMVNAKSGTMSRVKSYAGYAQNMKGDTLVFAIIANNYTCASKDMTKRMEDIMVKLVEY